MSQSSLLELLSVTSNAVKALDKTNSSKSSGSGGGTPRDDRISVTENQPPQSPHSNHSRSSRDSGVGKTATQSQPTSKQPSRHGAEDDSDHSTTASDVLIRSTVIDQPAQRPASLNSSSSSRASRCEEVNNFNIADAKQVKVSKKHLREIFSSRESFDSKESDAGSRPNSASALNSSNNNIAANTNRTGAPFVTRNENMNNGVSRKPGTGNQPKQSITEKKFSGQRQGFSHGPGSYGSDALPAYTVQRHERDSKDEKKGSGNVPLKLFPYAASSETAKQSAAPPASKDIPLEPGDKYSKKGQSELKDRPTKSASKLPLDVDKATFDSDDGGKAKLDSGKFPYGVSRHGGPLKEQCFVEPEEPYEVERMEGNFSLLI
jgi:hypothetical protein